VFSACLMLQTPVIAQVSGSGIGTGSSVDQSSAAGNGELSEIVVTAQKRVERLIDVPIPVTAVNPQSLEQSGEVKITDFYMQVPGLSVSPGELATQTLAIRGITSGAYSAATVGLLVDDVPFGGTGSNVVPDLDPGDLQRIEVLRGPQGALYGASTMGGLIKYVSLDPSTSEVSGRVSVGTESVTNGTSLGYTARGSVNLPVSSNFAIRVSGYDREDPGYLDNATLGVRGINEDHSQGGHIAALWTPTDVFSARFSVLYQQTNGESPNATTPAFGRYQQDYIASVGPYNKKSSLYSLELTDKLGPVTLTSISGYNFNEFHDTWDVTPSFGGPGNLTDMSFGVTGAGLLSYGSTSKWTQELRAAVPIGSMFDVLAGLFYTHEGSQSWQNIYGANPTTGEIAGSGYFGTQPSIYDEYAGFATLTYHATSALDLEVGGRFSKIEQFYSQQAFTGDWIPAFYGGTGTTYIVGEESAGSKPVTFLFTPRYTFSPDVMAYMRIASGYRPGGSNGNAPGVPPQYSPDKTITYEIGSKGEVLDRLLSFDASLYYIRWQGIQVELSNAAGYIYNANASQAKSDGIELSLSSTPITGLKIAGWITAGNAEITKTLIDNNAGLYTLDGDRLPYSTRFSGNLSVDGEHNLGSELKGTAGLLVAYVGNREAELTSSPERQYLPAYVRTDVHAGLSLGGWSGRLFINNIFNKDGVIAGGVGSFPSGTFYYIQPRTVGGSITRSF
jgi:outer membrane receptor protein involved in Fe transport